MSRIDDAVMGPDAIRDPRDSIDNNKKIQVSMIVNQWIEELGTHFYGNIEYSINENSVLIEKRVEYRLSKRMAHRMNVGDFGWDYKTTQSKTVLYKVGDRSTRFFSRASLIKAAHKMCRELFGNNYKLTVY